jgi:hypothetical protein
VVSVLVGAQHELGASYYNDLDRAELLFLRVRERGTHIATNVAGNYVSILGLGRGPILD